MYSYRDVLDVKRRYERELFEKRGVRGVGIGYKITGGRATNELSVIALVNRKIRPVSALSSYDVVPGTLEGIRTDVVETGIIRVPPAPVTPLRQLPIRPAPGGCSIGHYRITAGTFGCLVKRGYDTFILSNNHVLAYENRGRKSDSILQPSPADGGRLPDHKIAELVDFSSIIFNRGINRVDAAIARPMNPADITSNIIDIGVPTGIVKANIGMPVIKSGRTTGVTRGLVTITDATIDVEYSGGRIARFENQIIATTPGFSSGGDSGSIVLEDRTRRVCGLLFAGSEYATVINRIEDVFSALRVNI
ncbi:MAG: hypothetical protein QMD22_11800 [archaeon]|nr:hypothetical protein [archaeon]